MYVCVLVFIHVDVEGVPTINSNCTANSKA